MSGDGSKDGKAQRADQEKADQQALAIIGREGESDADAHARAMTSPTINAGITAFRFHSVSEGADVNALVTQIQKQALSVRNGCMHRPEAMLVAQAHTLDVLFNTLAQRAGANMKAGHLRVAETYMRMALKAQSQCRTTLEALEEIKFPKSATFVKQQNIAHNQQVNNGTSPAATPRAHEKDVTTTNELLEHMHGERLDFGAQDAAGGVNPHLEAVGTFDGAEL